MHQLHYHQPYARGFGAAPPPTTRHNVGSHASPVRTSGVASSPYNFTPGTRPTVSASPLSTSHAAPSAQHRTGKSGPAGSHERGDGLSNSYSVPGPQRRSSSNVGREVSGRSTIGGASTRSGTSSTAATTVAARQVAHTAGGATSSSTSVAPRLTTAAVRPDPSRPRNQAPQRPAAETADTTQSAPREVSPGVVGRPANRQLPQIALEDIAKRPLGFGDGLLSNRKYQDVLERERQLCQRILRLEEAGSANADDVVYVVAPESDETLMTLQKCNHPLQMAEQQWRCIPGGKFRVVGLDNQDRSKLVLRPFDPTTSDQKIPPLLVDKWRERQAQFREIRVPRSIAFHDKVLQFRCWVRHVEGEREHKERKMQEERVRARYMQELLDLEKAYITYIWKEIRTTEPRMENEPPYTSKDSKSRMFDETNWKDAQDTILWTQSGVQWARDSQFFDRLIPQPRSRLTAEQERVLRSRGWTDVDALEKGWIAPYPDSERSIELDKGGLQKERFLWTKEGAQKIAESVLPKHGSKLSEPQAQLMQSYDPKLLETALHKCWLKKARDQVRIRDWTDTSAQAVVEFILQISRTGQFQPCEMIIALYYMEVIQARTGLRISAVNWRPLLIVSVLFADKFITDQPVKTGDVVQFFPIIPTTEFMKLEKEVFGDIFNHNMMIQKHLEYFKNKVDQLLKEPQSDEVNEEYVLRKWEYVKQERGRPMEQHGRDEQGWNPKGQEERQWIKVVQEAWRRYRNEEDRIDRNRVEQEYLKLSSEVNRRTPSSRSAGHAANGHATNGQIQASALSTRSAGRQSHSNEPTPGRDPHAQPDPTPKKHYEGRKTMPAMPSAHKERLGQVGLAAGQRGAKPSGPGDSTDSNNTHSAQCPSTQLSPRQDKPGQMGNPATRKSPVTSRQNMGLYAQKDPGRGKSPQSHSPPGLKRTSVPQVIAQPKPEDPAPCGQAPSRPAELRPADLLQQRAMAQGLDSDRERMTPTGTSQTSTPTTTTPTMPSASGLSSNCSTSRTMPSQSQADASRTMVASLSGPRISSTRTNTGAAGRQDGSTGDGPRANSTGSLSGALLSGARGGYGHQSSAGGIRTGGAGGCGCGTSKSGVQLGRPPPTCGSAGTGCAASGTGHVSGGFPFASSSSSSSQINQQRQQRGGLSSQTGHSPAHAGPSVVATTVGQGGMLPSRGRSTSPGNPAYGDCGVALNTARDPRGRTVAVGGNPVVGRSGPPSLSPAYGHHGYHR